MEAGARGLLTPRRALLVVAGLGCGISPAFFGYFDISVWGPIGLGLIALALALLLARQEVPGGIAAAAVVALLLFAAWSLLSMGWAESADRALLEGDRWALYAVFTLVMTLLIAERRDGEAFILAAALGVVGVAGYDLAKMLSGDGASLFGETRLLEPLGYINGLGGFFLLGFWPLAAIAERDRDHLLSGLAAGGATLLATLVLLTDSRGTAFAFAASAAVLLALLPGRNRRAWLLLAVIAALALAWGPLTDVTATLPRGQSAPAESTIRHGAQWCLLVSALVAFVWGAAGWAIDSLRGRSPGFARRLPRASAALLAGIAVVAIVVAWAAAGNPARKVSDQYNAFTNLEKVETGVRFTSGGGNRYDYWRIAWDQFTEHPLDGVGAGNFDRTYFLERRTDEDVRQAHSIELGTLGETGLVGAVLLGSFLVAVFAGLWRRSRSARREDAEVGLTVAAAGIFVVWLAQTSVDWLHLIPGLTGIALGAAVVLLRPVDGGEGGGLRRLPAPALVGVLALAIAGIVFIGRPVLAQKYRDDARSEIDSNPARTLDLVADSLSLNPDSVQAYYLKAAALARLDAYPAARAVLTEAIAREPHNYVSWALRGDLETRRGALRAARRDYARAAALNPRDNGLRRLAASPAAIRRLHREPDSPPE